MRSIPVGVATLLLFSGCSLIRPEPTPAPIEPVTDPNLATTVVDETKQQISPRVTMLEENERLRELLSDSMSERNGLTQDVDRTLIENNRLQAHVDELTETLANLTQRLQEEIARGDQLRSTVEQKEADRKALAEMYASEKHQRLVFEKELLEMEISNRSIAGKDSK